MIHHYITKYWEDGKHYAEAWLQLNLFGYCICFSKRKMLLEENEALGDLMYLKATVSSSGVTYSWVEG